MITFVFRLVNAFSYNIFVTITILNSVNYHVIIISCVSHLISTGNHR
ncbi:hypothetical protein EUBVEN_02229 [Eubacterium ventriosum ATCC 27560]|uniref:Uncharacterized protein n=1 Tax=Eubacterium ventriosum ATCC 27560 TaxID=411463 RepID=A5Z936_9FIRM|nr:hypothetical protein EUBVEN_02229 [Eubacterium ventriosum ATCC 27560]